jgi:hypothetical protein
MGQYFIGRESVQRAIEDSRPLTEQPVRAQPNYATPPCDYKPRDAMIYRELFHDLRSVKNIEMLVGWVEAKIHNWSWSALTSRRSGRRPVLLNRGASSIQRLDSRCGWKPKSFSNPAI